MADNKPPTVWQIVGALLAFLTLLAGVIAALEARQHWAFEQWQAEHRRVHDGIWCAINPETCYGNRR